MKHALSLEFFPPKTPEGAEKLRATRARLYALQPGFCSVTFGAGGSTQDGTLAAVREILAEGMPAAPHLSCIGQTRESIRRLLADYRAAGVKRIVALRGDLPSGYGLGGHFQYASDLVAFIRAETGSHFHIEVAAYPEMHPQARSPRADMDAFAAKAAAGADSAITQYFFNADAYFRFVDELAASPTTNWRPSWPRAASPCPWPPASCPSPTPRSCCAFLMPAAPKCPAGCACAWKATATIWPPSAPSGWTWWPPSASACCKAARPACTCTP